MGLWVEAPPHPAPVAPVAPVSDVSSKVYIGQSGGKTKLRSMLKRFREHIRGGQKFTRKKHRYTQDEMSLYEAMHRHGPGHFFIVPLQITRREDIDHLEMQWINRVGSRVYNVRTESRWKSTRMFQHFYAPCSAPPSGHDWNDYVNTLIQKRGV